MNEVKRYNVISDKYGDGTVEESESGSVVFYEDYAELKAQRDALAALAEERRRFIVNGVEMGDILLPVIDGDPAIGIHERCLLKPKFAYDAYLNSVRAEGVDMFVRDLAELFKSLKVGGKPWQAVKGIAMRATSFAAKLRAGEKP